jgi:hypothetical protein
LVTRVMTGPNADPGRRARDFAYRAKSAEVISALQVEGVRPVVLKGLAFEQTLYPEGGRRPATDLDLMVSPDDRGKAGRVLRGLAYKPRFLPEDDAIGRAVHAETWRREADSTWLDLHLTLPEAACSPEVSWDALRGHLVPFELHSIPTLTLDRSATALLAALHAAHHGSFAGPTTEEDLRRAVALFEPSEWEVAAALAAKLGAVEAFAQGLATIEQGKALAARFGCGGEPSVRRRLLWAGAPWGAVVVDELARSSPVRWPVVAVRLLAPNPRSLRASSPLARRGVSGLILAYTFRPFLLLAKVPEAVKVWRRTRADARSE